VTIQTYRVAKLPSGLELWISEDRAYTVPERSGVREIEQTLIEVAEWARKHRPPHPEAVAKWLEKFENQHSYLSPGMPKRQEREVFNESARELIGQINAQLKKTSK
jgi:hypothetical protein